MDRIVFVHKSHGNDPNAERLRYAVIVCSFFNQYEKLISKSTDSNQFAKVFW